MTSNIENKIKKMAPKMITQKEKDKLWSGIKDNMPIRQSKPFYQQNPFAFFALNSKIALVAGLILVLISGSAITVAASDDAKPGDVLFPLDRAVEKIQLTFSSKDNQGKLRIKFAKERVKEAKEVLSAAESEGADSQTATSSDDSAASSPDLAKGKGPKNLNYNKVVKSEQALAFALGYLEEVKEEIKDKGDATTSVAIDEIIGELTGLAEGHVSDLNKFKKEIKSGDIQLKAEIKKSAKDIKLKFKIKENKGKKDKDDEGNEYEYEYEYEYEESGNEDNGNNDNNNKKITICHIPPGNPSARHTIEIGRPALEAHLTRGDTIGECGDEELTPEPESDTTAPVISAIAAGSITTTSASIIWQTDEDADSKVYYSTTSPVTTSSDSVSSAVLTLNHEFDLIGLTASTTYYYIVRSADQANNIATSTENSFITFLQ